ncbi:sensor histidine kinase [Pseudohalocynthiibacter aestuariivivens]|nr:ATP-binding protein [Pseudohalocynthiibacter aestuariivivens]QIE45840.1 sensor histidine kinase [Pseudohalocynthiibacter aestuariivivens]
MRRPLAILIFLGITALLSGGAWWLGYRTSLVQVADRGAADLRLAADRLVGQLARYRLIAVRLADHPDVVRLAQSGDASGIEALFLDVADQSGAFEVAFFAANGQVTATSSDGPPMAHSGDKPAFARAMTGALGLDHGRATDGATRTFTFMAPVFSGTYPQGAIAVRVDMEAVEESDWRGAPQVVFFTDKHDQVFVTNRSELLFRNFGTGAPADFAPTTTRQIGGIEIWRNAAGPYVPRRAVYREQPLPVIGLTGRALISTAPAERIAGLQAAVVAALCLAFGAVLFLVLERRRTLALANAGLEQRVARRTAALAAANTALRHEVTERKEAEHALRRAQADLVQAGKLSALGQMSAGISHELNQPLMAIRSFSENAALFLDKGRTVEARANLDRIADLSRRMARIIKNLRAFARQENEPMTDVDIVSVVSSVLEMTDSRLRTEGVTVDWSPQPGVPPVQGGEVRLQQVLLNLVTNALDAMVDRTPKRLEINVTPGMDHVEVTVRDTGPGLVDAGKIFDPFYTTKQVGASEEGMGLGLSISYGLVQSFGGAIHGRNHPQGGAIFTVRLATSRAEVAA